MPVFLLKLNHMSESQNMLMYIQTIRFSLYEKGADWQSYVEAVRLLCQAHNWGWESVCWYLWMNASEGPFGGKGKASWSKVKWPSTKTCFIFDWGEVYNAATCRYTHVL